METEYVFAVIGACATVVAPILALYFQRHFDNRPYKSIDSSKKAICGNWNGSIMQNVLGNDESIPIEINFRTKGKKLIADLIVTYKAQLIHLVASGNFPSDRYILLNYRNKKDTTLQFGSIIAALNAKGDIITGLYAGYGSTNERIISGKISLSKINS